MSTTTTVKPPAVNAFVDTTAVIDLLTHGGEWDEPGISADFVVRPTRLIYTKRRGQRAKVEFYASVVRVADGITREDFRMGTYYASTGWSGLRPYLVEILKGLGLT